MDETIDSGIEQTDTQLTMATRRSFQKAAKWAYFLSIVGFIGIGLLVLGAVSMFIFDSALSDMSNYSSFSPALYALLYLIVGGIYLIPILRLMRFANYTKAWLSADRSTDLENGIRNLAGMFSFMGIFTIVTLGVYAIAIVGALVYGLSA